MPKYKYSISEDLATNWCADSPMNGRDAMHRVSTTINPNTNYDYAKLTDIFNIINTIYDINTKVKLSILQSLSYEIRNNIRTYPNL